MSQVERIGRFEVQERLKANPFVIVYRGRDPFDGRRVQIRFCVATDESVRKRFFVAAEQASILRHPNIATVFEFGSGDGKPYLVQEAFSEESLGDLLARGEPIEDVLKLYYLVQITKGLQYAHAQEVLHRELRPASILVDRNGDLKIADFGTARLASACAHLGNGAHRWPAVGWLLPELLLGLDLDLRSDIYGFGALAFELLTGRPPFAAESLAELVPQILESDPRPVGVHWAECPPEIDRLVLRCLSRDPGQRYASMDEVADDLGSIVPITESNEVFDTDVFEEESTRVIEDVNSLYAAGAAGQTATVEPIADLPAVATVAESPVATVAVPLASLQPVAAPTVIGTGLPGQSLTPKPRARPITTVPTIEGKTTTAEPPGLPPSRGVDWNAVSEGLLRAGKRATDIASGSLEHTGVAMGRLVASFPRRARVGMLGLLVALLVGAVGWNLVGESASDPETLPIVAPERSVVPVAPESGRLLVDAQPWGKIVQVVDGRGNAVRLQGDPYTPLVLELEPGEYRIDVSRPEMDRIETCFVTVSAGAISSCELQLAVVQATDFFKQTGWWQ